MTPDADTIFQADPQDLPNHDQTSGAPLAQAEDHSKDEAASRPVRDLLIDINWKDYFIKTAGVGILGILYSSVLFLLTTPNMSEIVQENLGVSSIGAASMVTFQSVLL